jgi:hypothetical protein
MVAAGLLLPNAPGNEALRKAAGAGAQDADDAGRVLDTVIRKVSADAKEAPAPAQETLRVKR